MNGYEKIIDALQKAGKEGYLVGGCVRDHLIGITPNDFDVTTNALPQEMREIFSSFKVIETGLKHGTLTVLCEGETIEVTTYRVDGNYSDGRHPDSVCFSKSLEEDLKRRDFTVNAMAMTVDGRVIDPFGGREDLKKGVIRAVGDPYQRFKEDALRILRAVRFASVLDFEIDSKTQNAAVDLRHTIDQVSRERCFSEFKKALCGKGIERVLMSNPLIFATLLPEIEKMIGYDQMNPHHCYDLLTHTAKAVASTPPTPVFRLAALLHDTGKPDTRSFDEQGIAHYYGHAAKSTAISEIRLKELKCDHKTRDEVLFLVSHHDAPPENDIDQIAKKLRRFGEERLRALILLRRADNMAQSKQYHRTHIHDQCCMWIDELILEKERCFTVKNLKINGNDLMSWGIPEGPAIGQELERILTAVSEGVVANNKAALEFYVKNSKI